MKTYLVRRSGIAAGATELRAALTRLRSFEEEAPMLPVRWLHSYALREADGCFGLACVFQADSRRTLERHALLTRLPAQEILPVAATVMARRFAPTMVHLVRRRRFWRSATELDRSAAMSHLIADEEMPRAVSWLRSYSVHEDDATLGTFCLFQAVSAEALREHADRVAMPADEIVPVIGRIAFREEPAPQPDNGSAIPA